MNIRLRHRVARRVLRVGAVAAFAALALAPSALAHATLRASTPSTDAVLTRSPALVVLRFDEPVETVTGSVRVYDGQAQRVDTGVSTRPDARAVTVGLPAGLPNDTYTVAWRVISGDSHPVHGAFVFHVGKPAAGAAGVAAQVLDADGRSRTVDIAFAIVRFITLALILLCVGGVTALAFVLRQAGIVVRQGLCLGLSLAAALLGVASLAWIAVEGADAAGMGLDASLRPALLRDVAETSFGQIWLLRAVLAFALCGVALLAARPGRAVGATTLALAAAIAATPALSGHARTEGALAIASDVTHVVSAGAWVGGLAFLLLALALAGGRRWQLAATAVPRFSTIAVGSVTVLIVAGTVNGLLEVRSWHGLWDTTYGRLLLAKISLLLPLLALGAFNNRVLVRHIGSGLDAPRERRMFLRATAAEIVVMVAIVGVTGVLVGERPAKAQIKAVSGPISRDSRIGPFDLNLVVDPAHTGRNEMHVYLLDRSSGQPVQVDETRVSASLPAAGIGPLRFTATPAGPGHAVVTDASFPLAGQWRLLVEVRRGDFDEWSTTLNNIQIRKGTSP